jgi:hypothetical protein
VHCRADAPARAVLENFWILLARRTPRGRCVAASRFRPSRRRASTTAPRLLEDIAILAGGVLPKDYNCPALDKVMLGELIDLVTGIATGEQADKAKDILDRVYEYLLLHYVRKWSAPRK